MRETGGVATNGASLTGGRSFRVVAGADDRAAGSGVPAFEFAGRCASALAAARDADRVHTMFAHLAPHLDLDAFASFRADDDGKLRCDAAEGFAGDAPASLSEPLASIAATLTAGAQYTFVVDARTPSRDLARTLRALGFRIGVAIAFRSENRLRGVLLFASRDRSRFTRLEIGLVDIVGACLAAIEELRTSSRAARFEDAAKSEFLAVLAHELRNPLASVRNALEILRASDRRPSAVERSAQAMIERQLEQIAWLADDLLDANQAALGRITLDRQRVQLASVLEDAAAKSQPWIEASRHELVIDLPREPISLDADPNRLTRVFSNLLNNAARHMGRGGRIEMTAAPQDAFVTVLLRAAAGDGSAASLHELFAVAEGDTVLSGRAEGGFTAGVALVKKFVEMHGGALAVRADAAERTIEFAVSLPTARGAGQLRVPPPSSEVLMTTRNDPQRVLIADDNADSAESTGMLLRLMGNDVRIACDGLDAVEQAEAFQPDVVLLDIGMPRLDGYEAARRIRAQDWSRDTLLVAVTGWGSRDDDAKAAAAGFDRRFTKPLDPAELRRILARERTH